MKWYKEKCLKTLKHLGDAQRYILNTMIDMLPCDKYDKMHDNLDAMQKLIDED